MNCRSCGFINMRNAAVCAQCGARLVWEGTPRKADLHPPRAKKGALGARDRASQRIVVWWVRLTRSFPALQVFQRVPRQNLARGLASIIPGGGQFLLRRFREGALLLAAWILAALAAGWGSGEVGPASAVTRFLFFRGLPSVMASIHFFSVVRALQLPLFCRTNAEARVIALCVALLLLPPYMLAASRMTLTV